MVRTSNTVNAVSKFFLDATKEVLDASTGKEIAFAKTIQKVPVIHLRPEIGCFVLFSGDYSGLMIMNFSGDAAMAIYKSSMMHMGLPEEELATEYTADEVVDNVGEMINQIIGAVRRKIEGQYGLTATATQPKAIALNTSIVLTIDSHEVEKDLCRRMSFKVDGHPFHIELSMEKTEFISIEGKNVHEVDATSKTKSSKDINMEDYMDAAGSGEAAAEPAKKSSPNDDLDFDALFAANK